MLTTPVVSLYCSKAAAVWRSSGYLFSTNHLSAGLRPNRASVPHVPDRSPYSLSYLIKYRALFVTELQFVLRLLMSSKVELFQY